MKKYMKYLIYSFLFTLILLSCEKEKDSAGVSRVTNYVTFELQQGEVYLLPLGTPFTEPGYTAIEGETDKTSEVIVQGEVDPNTIGLYTISYLAENKDGFTSSVERTVVVYDPDAPETDISGIYNSSVERIDPNEAYDELEVVVTMVAPGIFEFSDLLGGFYALGRGFGPAYAAHGFLQLQNDNTLVYISSEVPGFGDSLDGVENGTYDPATGTISFSSFYVGIYQFDVVLTPVEE